MSWQELGDGVFRCRYESLDLNVGLVVGEEHVVVIDSRATHSQADELLDHVRRITTRPVSLLVNTHHHWDHTFGNARFTDAEIVGHIRCRDTLTERGETMRRRLLEADWIPDEARPHFADVVITPPTRVFDSELTLDLGGRTACLSYLGRGHTDNDIVIAVDEVLFAGDLVEEGAPPQFGDAHPTEWVETLGVLAAAAGGTVVPGHGDIVDRAYVEAQRDDITRAIDGEEVFPPPIMDQLRSRL